MGENKVSQCNISLRASSMSLMGKRSVMQKKTQKGKDGNGQKINQFPKKGEAGGTNSELGEDTSMGKEYVKAVYCHPAYLTYMQSSTP